MNTHSLADIREFVSTRHGRRKRVDEYGVDRSRFRGLSLPRSCEEMNAAEPRLQQIREHSTVADRMDAYRKFFSND